MLGCNITSNSDTSMGHGDTNHQRMALKVRGCGPPAFERSIHVTSQACLEVTLTSSWKPVCDHTCALDTQFMAYRPPFTGGLQSHGVSGFWSNREEF